MCANITVFRTQGGKYAGVSPPPLKKPVREREGPIFFLFAMLILIDGTSLMHTFNASKSVHLIIHFNAWSVLLQILLLNSLNLPLPSIFSFISSLSSLFLAFHTFKFCWNQCYTGIFFIFDLNLPESLICIMDLKTTGGIYIYIYIYWDYLVLGQHILMSISQKVSSRALLLVSFSSLDHGLIEESWNSALLVILFEILTNWYHWYQCNWR